MNIEQLRFSYEEHLFRVVTAQIGSVFSRSSVEAQNLLNNRKRDLLGDAVRVTDDLLPEIHRIYQSSLDLLGGSLSGDLFVRHSEEYNAGVFAYEKQFDLLIHSALLNDFTHDELKFVLGHELGHVVFDHSRFSVNEILSTVQGISPDTADILFRWSRAAEISADRIGLLCCGQLTAAVTALFKTSSGLSGIDEDRILRSFRKQYDDLEIQLKEKNTNPFSWIRTHPMIPIRFKALELAALDIIAFSRGFGVKGFKAVDQQIGKILESIDVYVIH